jgi:hypothetical protein
MILFHFSGFGDISSTMLFGSFQASVTYLILFVLVFSPFLLGSSFWVRREREVDGKKIWERRELRKQRGWKGGRKG